MSQSLYHLIPGLQQAVERESSIRNQSFLELPEVVCGLEVRPLTIRHVLTLTESGNVFMCGGVPSVGDIGAFFVVVAEPKAGWQRWNMLRKIGRLKPSEAFEGIKQYISESFQDKPSSKGGDSTPYYSDAAAMVDVFASQYGWAEREIINTPVKRLFQYVKAIQKRNNPKAILFNPSGRIICKYLKDQNANAGRDQN